MFRANLACGQHATADHALATDADRQTDTLYGRRCAASSDGVGSTKNSIGVACVRRMIADCGQVRQNLLTFLKKLL
ncbi:MAG: hypothetical protein OXC62_15940, partial [Aestuariivita sp.]|nr:hypothetical protein [Aestuariivita sp.]